ncbi:MAG: PAS domain-containing protein [Alphaproteobacteria bacterium]|nr:MAG: PAS domain-containing protein [Alphaproteobacteria bacterium]
MLHTDQDFTDLVDYWQHLKSECGTVPSRRRFNPMDVPWLLPSIFLLERRDRFDLHVRLVGTALDALATRPLTGQNYLSYYPENEWPAYDRYFGAVVGQPCGGWMDRMVTTTSGHGYRALSLALPLATEAGEVRYIIGLIHPRVRQGDPRKAPSGNASSQTYGMNFLDLGYGVPAP